MFRSGFLPRAFASYSQPFVSNCVFFQPKSPLVAIPRASIPQFFFRSPKNAFWGRNLRMAQSRRQVRPRSSNLDVSASFCARNPNKASMTLMPAAASICATDVLERHLAQPGSECCERELLGRLWCRDWAMRIVRLFLRIRKTITRRKENYEKKMVWGPPSK